MELARGVLVLAALVGVYALIFGGLRRRPGRPGSAPFSGIREVGAEGLSAIALAVLGLLAISTDETVQQAALIGLATGGLLGLGMRIAPVLIRTVMGAIGVVAALATAKRFVLDSSSTPCPWDTAGSLSSRCWPPSHW